MGEPYTIRVFVPDGDPEGPKIVELLNWTGIGISFPRAAWPRMSSREEFKRSGVYILVGSGEGESDDLPMIYVGQGEEIGARIELHYAKKEFWNWCYAFVSSGNALNRAHITWLEHSLVWRAKQADRCHLDNANNPREPGLSESEKADTMGFLREMLRILPLLGVRVFEKPQAIAVQSKSTASVSHTPDEKNMKDTVVVPAKEDGFNEVFIGENCWYAIRIGGGMLQKIRYIAAYQSSPVSAVTHYAPVERIEPYGDEGKYRLIFAEPAKPMPHPVPLSDALPGAMQGPRYTNLKRLLASKQVTDFLM
jgi:hypothetical protein